MFASVDHTSFSKDEVNLSKDSSLPPSTQNSPRKNEDITRISLGSIGKTSLMTTSDQNVFPCHVNEENKREILKHPKGKGFRSYPNLRMIQIEATVLNGADKIGLDSKHKSVKSEIELLYVESKPSPC